MGATSKFCKAQAGFNRLVEAFRHDEEGATAIEYGLIVALIFLAVVGAIRAYTGSTNDMYNTIETTLNDSM